MLYDKRHQVFLRDLFSSDGGPYIEDLLGCLYMGESIAGVQVLREVIIREVTIFLQLGEPARNGPKICNHPWIFSGKRKVSRAQKSI
ncbi:MAG: hypothetical protein ACLQU1_29730 [Bryobacteraceae bacterium]